MFVHLCLALLALSSLSAASEPDCDEHIKPLEDQSKIYGKWIFQILASDNEQLLKEIKISNSSWSTVFSTPESNDISMTYADRIDGKCVYGNASSTPSGNLTKLTFLFNSTSYEHFGRYLETCPDCVLWMDEAVSEANGEQTKTKGLYLFTKTGKLDDSQLEVFKKQAECLNIKLDFYFPDTTDLCPEVKTEEQ
ncbi:uncharacterized protein ACNS7B_010728 [Menidia menidia]